MSQLIDLCEICISNNFLFLLDQINFLKISCHHVEDFLNLRPPDFDENRFFEIIVKWVKFDVTNREQSFSKLFALINLTNIEKWYIKSKIADDLFVLNNLECMQAVVRILRLPDDLGQAFSSFVMIGGETTFSYVREYDVSASSWQNLPEMDRVCLDVGLAYVSGVLYVIGGRMEHSMNSYTDVHALDLNRTHFGWVEKSFLRQKRHNFGCTAIANEIYVAGGRAHKTEWLSSVECYNVKDDNQWSRKSSMNYKRAGCCLVELNGRLHALGGSCNGVIYSSIEVFDGCRWCMGNDMQKSRTDFAAVVFNNKIYAFGGLIKDNCYRINVEIYDEEAWNLFGHLQIPRSGHSAFMLQDKIYIVGGVDRCGAVDPMEVYDPQSEKSKIIGDVDGDGEGAKSVAIFSKS